MVRAKVTTATPHRYVDSDLLPNETLAQWRGRQEAERAALRAQARRTKARVLASLLRK